MPTVFSTGTVSRCVYRRRVLALGAVALAGCLDRSEPDSDRLVQDALETRLAMTDLSARRTLTIETPEQTTERVEEVRERPPGEIRREVVDSTDDAAPEGSVVVRARNATWTYDPVTGDVVHRHHPNRVVADRTRMVLENLSEGTELSYEGTDTVDGREAHRISAESSGEGVRPAIILVIGNEELILTGDGYNVAGTDEMTVTRTLWIDEGRRYPTAERTEVQLDGAVTHRIRLAYEDLVIDGGFDSEPFTFDPPPGAEVVTTGLEPEGIFESVAAAEANAPYDLPDPDVPERYGLDRITVVETGAGVTSTIWYVDTDAGGRELFVATRDHQRFDEDVLEEVDLDGLTAYRREGRIDSVFWACDGLTYEVSKPIGEAPIEEIAASIGCP